MAQEGSVTIGQVISSLTTKQAWGALVALATILAGVATGAFWAGKQVAGNEAARQAQEDASTRSGAVSDALIAKQEAASWKDKYDTAKESLKAANERAEQAEANAGSAVARYNACAGQNAAIAALENRLLQIDVALGNAERLNRDEPEIAVGLREQQRILNEGLANCGAPKR